MPTSLSSTFHLHFSDFTYPPLNASSDATSLECESLVSSALYFYVNKMGVYLIPLFFGHRIGNLITR